MWAAIAFSSTPTQPGFAPSRRPYWKAPRASTGSRRSTRIGADAPGRRTVTVPSASSLSSCRSRSGAVSWTASIGAISQQSPSRPCRGCRSRGGASGPWSSFSAVAEGPGPRARRSPLRPAPGCASRARPVRASARRVRRQVRTRGRRALLSTSSARWSTADSVGVDRDDLLPGALHDLVEPGLGDVEGLVAGDPLELDGAQHVPALLVVPDQARAALEGDLDGVVGHRLDQPDVLRVRGGRTGEVAGLLDHDLLGAELLRELLREPLAGVDGVDLDVAEGVLLRLLAAGLHLGDDLGDARALGEEDVHAAGVVHDGLEALGLGLDVERQLGQEHGVDVPALGAVADPGQPLLLRVPVLVVLRRLRGEVAAGTAHDLVDDEHLRVRAVLGDDVLGEDAGLLRGGLRAERLADRHDQ